MRVNKDLIEDDRGWPRTKPSEIKQKTLEIKHIIRKFSNFWHFIILDDRSNLRNTFNFHSISKFLLFQLFVMTKRGSYMKIRLRLIVFLDSRGSFNNFDFNKKDRFLFENMFVMNWLCDLKVFKFSLINHEFVVMNISNNGPTWTYSYYFGAQ